jgi:ATP-binding protein involved in chromosome partitioning
MPLTTDAVIDALRPVQDPELHRSIVDLDMVRDVAIKRGTVDVTIALTVAGCPMRNEIDNRVKGAISVLDDVRDVRITFTVMTDDERRRCATSSTVTRPRRPARKRRTVMPKVGRSRSLTPRAAPECCLSHRARAASASHRSPPICRLHSRSADKRVAVIDADVWGFSIPRMLGVDRPPVVIDQMLIPPEVHGVRCISMGFFADEDQPSSGAARCCTRHSNSS